MQRREALKAKQETRKPRPLLESDYLLGVFDTYRMGGLRFKLDPNGPFLDDQATMAAPPMALLRSLEEASLHLEDDSAGDDPAFSARAPIPTVTWKNCGAALCSISAFVTAMTICATMAFC